MNIQQNIDTQARSAIAVTPPVTPTSVESIESVSRVSTTESMRDAIISQLVNVEAFNWTSEDEEIEPVEEIAVQAEEESPGTFSDALTLIEMMLRCRDDGDDDDWGTCRAVRASTCTALIIAACLCAGAAAIVYLTNLNSKIV